MADTNTFAERVWYALHCLPRDERGEAPSLNRFEDKHGLPRSFMRKLLSGEANWRKISLGSFLSLVDGLGLKDLGGFKWLATGEAPKHELCYGIGKRYISMASSPSPCTSCDGKGNLLPILTGPITPLEEKYPRDGRGER